MDILNVSLWLKQWKVMFERYNMQSDAIGEGGGMDVL